MKIEDLKVGDVIVYYGHNVGNYPHRKVVFIQEKYVVVERDESGLAIIINTRQVEDYKKVPRKVEIDEDKFVHIWIRSKSDSSYYVADALKDAGFK